MNIKKILNEHIETKKILIQYYSTKIARCNNESDYEYYIDMLHINLFEYFNLYKEHNKL